MFNLAQLNRRFFSLIRLVLGTLSALVLFVMMVLTLGDVVGRYFLDSPIRGSYEITETLLSLAVFSALPLVTLDRENISVSLFDNFFQGNRGRIRDVVIGTLVTLTLLTIAWQLTRQALNMLEYGDASLFLRIPYGWIAMVMASMSALAALCSLFLTVLGICPTNPQETR